MRLEGNCTISFGRGALGTSLRGSLAVVLALIVAACGDDGQNQNGGGGGGGGGNGDSCSDNGDCAGGYACDFGQVGGGLTLKQGDVACFDNCSLGCDPEDFACFETCAETCQLTCDGFCEWVCAGDPGCAGVCQDDCELEDPTDPGTPDAGGGGGDAGPGGELDAGIPGFDLGSGGGGGGGGGGGSQGVCRQIPGGDEPDAGGGDTGSTEQPIEWAGTWSAHAVYTASCQWSSLGAPRTVEVDERITVQVSGSGGSFSAVFDNNDAYTMTGPGSATRLTLSGPFPGRDHNDDAATQVAADNNVDIVLEEIPDNNTARGSLSGTYDTSGGVSCTIEEGGGVEFTR